MSKLKFPALDLAPLPTELVGRILNRMLAPGMVHFAAAEQDHSFERHGKEFLACLPYAAATVLAPTYVGQSPKHPDGFELVREAEGIAEMGGHVLVAINIAPSGAGRYGVRSVYPIGRSTAMARVRKAHLFKVMIG